MIGRREECIEWLWAQEPGEYECRRKRKPRTTTQNAYYWAMLNQLARAIGISNPELHEQMLRDYGVCEFTWVRVDVPAWELFDHWEETYRTLSTEDCTYREVKALKGSSKMNSAEFSRLIEGMRWECEQVGLDVKTPEEIARLKFIEPDRR